MIKKFAENNSDYLYFVFRIVIGVLFFMHGWTKFTGLLAGNIQLTSLFGMAGVIEVVVGILLVLGLFVRWAAFFAAIEMIVAFLVVHVKSGFNPLKNGGEPAVLFFAAFLVLLAFGARKWALERR